MNLGPIDFPFLNDGLGYFSKLAAAYIEPSFFDGLAHLWGHQEQGLLLFSWIFLCLKFFGFSYQMATYAQIAWCVFLSLLLGRNVSKLVEGELSRKFKIFPYLLILSFYFGFGFYSAIPGNVFDLRVDISGALFLTLAIVSLPERSWTTLFWVALAFLERFHNMSVILAFSFLAVSVDFLRDLKRGGIPALSFKRYLLFLLWPVLGILSIALIRFRAVRRLLEYYRSVQLDSSSDWVVPWGGDGFFSFYPKQFHELFVGNVGAALFIGLCLFFSVWTFWKFRERKINKADRYAVFLTSSALLVFLMLIVNPTRNNGGVLRFALAPALLALSLFAFNFVATRYTKKLTGMAFLICSILIFLGLRRTKVFYDSFDYFAFRSSDAKSQILFSYDKIDQLVQQEQRDLSIGAMYAMEYNFNPKLWPIYLAFRGKQAASYQPRSLFGVEHRIEDIEDLKRKLQEVDVLAIPSETCLQRWIPADGDYRELLEQFGDRLRSQCGVELSVLELGDCHVSLRSCLIR